MDPRREALLLRDAAEELRELLALLAAQGRAEPGLVITLERADLLERAARIVFT